MSVWASRLRPGFTKPDDTRGAWAKEGRCQDAESADGGDVSMNQPSEPGGTPLSSLGA